MTKVKILCIFSGTGGGISSWIRNACKNCNVWAVIDAVAFSMKDNNEFKKVVKTQGGKCYQMPQIAGSVRGILKLLKYVDSLVKRNRYNIIHCHMNGYYAFLFWIVAIKNHIPFIAHSHQVSIEKNIGRIYENMLSRLNRCFNLFYKNKIACSETAAVYAYGNTKNVKILYNGIDETNIEEPASRDEDTINLLMVGRLNKVKNHSFAIDVSEELKERAVPFTLRILGEGNLKDDILQQIKEKKLEDKVKYIGYVDDLKPFYLACDTVIVPSLYESFSFVSLEAQQYGCNVIINASITREADLEIGLVSYLGIDTDDIIKWADLIQSMGKKKAIPSEEINNALSKHKLLNKNCYQEYKKIIWSILEKATPN